MGSIPIARSISVLACTPVCLRHKYSGCKEGTIVAIYSTCRRDTIALTHPLFC